VELGSKFQICSSASLVFRFFALVLATEFSFAFDTVWRDVVVSVHSLPFHFELFPRSGCGHCSAHSHSNEGPHRTTCNDASRSATGAIFIAIQRAESGIQRT
jgi:hypothetical protein